MRNTLNFLRNSLTANNSARSFNSSGVESFADDAEENTGRERRKKRRGKRGNSVGSESRRSRSSEGRTATRHRRGRRVEKSKPPSDNTSTTLDESFEFEPSLN